MLCPTGHTPWNAGGRFDERCSVPLVTPHGILVGDLMIDALSHWSNRLMLMIGVLTYWSHIVQNRLMLCVASWDTVGALCYWSIVMGRCWCSVLLVNSHGMLLVLCPIGQSSWDAAGALSYWSVVMGRCSVLLVSRHRTLLVLCAIGQSSRDAVGALCYWSIVNHYGELTGSLSYWSLVMGLCSCSDNRGYSVPLLSTWYKYVQCGQFGSDNTIQ